MVTMGNLYVWQYPQSGFVDRSYELYELVAPAAYPRPGCQAAYMRLDGLPAMLALSPPQLFALLVCAGTATAVPMRELDQLERSAPDVLVRMNPLKGLAPLQKPHHSWGLPNYYLNSSSTFVDGVVYDYVRITGSCSINLIDVTAFAVESCVMICKAVAAARKWGCLGVAPAPSNVFEDAVVVEFTGQERCLATPFPPSHTNRREEPEVACKRT